VKISHSDQDFPVKSETLIFDNPIMYDIS